jgi:three-Cys-motif partner protein
MAQKSFPTAGTMKKLHTIADYMQFYVTALSGKFKLTYIDPFAGTGEIPLREGLPLFDGKIEYERVIEGSVKKALSVKPPFDNYLLTDLQKAHVNDLSELYSQMPSLAGKVRIEKGDANEIVKNYCKQHNPSTDRAILFLDPYGNQVHWTTLEVVAKTRGIDVWYLFPSFMGIARQMSESGAIQKDAEASMNLVFGDRSWFEALTRPSEVQEDFFGLNEVAVEKIPFAAVAATKHMIAKMKTIFPGIVLDEWLPLGKRKGHWYSLIFGCTNDSPKAIELARRVAKDIMKLK